MWRQDGRMLSSLCWCYTWHSMGAHHTLTRSGHPDESTWPRLAQTYESQAHPRHNPWNPKQRNCRTDCCDQPPFLHYEARSAQN